MQSRDEIKVMFEEYMINKLKLNNLQNENNKIERQKDLIIESQNLVSKEITDMPTMPPDSMKNISPLLIHFDEEYTKLINKQTFIKKNIEDLEHKIVYVDNTLDYLKSTNQTEELEVFSLYSLKNMNIDQISIRLNMSRATIYRKISDTIDILSQN